MKLLFIADPLAQFNLKKDSTYAMMKAATHRGHTIASCEVSAIRWRNNGEGVVADVAYLAISSSSPSSELWYTITQTKTHALASFDAILMRKDPPFDSEFFYTTHLLSQAEREGAKVFNAPQALREHPEKLALMEFGPFAPPTLVSRSESHLRAFHAEHGDIILKPLDGMGGKGIFRITNNGMNLGSILETLNQNSQSTVMAQRYLPEIKDGDKRILLINGEAVPYGLARIPQGQEIRGNLAAGGKGVAQALSPHDWHIAQTLGPVLAQRGLFLVGLDVIGNHVTEINVTSPTCFQEIQQQTGYDVAEQFIKALENITNTTL